MRVIVVPWSSRWSAEFAAVREELLAACSAVPVLSVEHVGSTSVRGLAAKPVLDVTVVVARNGVRAAVAALEDAGYRYLGERGIPDRHAFEQPPHGPARHVYVAVDGALSLRNQLAVREALSADADLRDRYGECKLALAMRDLEGMDEYVAEKSPMLQEILQRSGRFSDDELQAIETMNRGARPEG